MNDPNRQTYIPTCFSFKVAELLKILTDGSISVAVGDKLSTLVVRKTGSAIDLVNKVGNLFFCVLNKLLLF